MHIVNLYSVLVVCLFGIVCSSWFNEPSASASAASPAANSKGINYEDDYYNVAQKDSTSPASAAASRKRRYILDVQSFGKTCLLEYENVCETADYSIHVKNGISGHVIKASLIQKESSDLVSVHNLTDTFSKDGSVQFIFKSIPSLHYSVVLEMSDLINNADYDIGNNCHCHGCSDNTRVIDLSEMENRITHTVRSDKKNKITFPQKTFVHGNFLFSKFLYFHSELNVKTIEHYTQLYSYYNELVHPCSGTIMTHSVNYNIHYDMSTVHCYHVHMVDKFVKKIHSAVGDERISGRSALNFMGKNSQPILIKLEDRLSHDNLVTISGKNYKIQLPLRYEDNGYYSSRGSVVGRLVTIYTRHVFFQKKYIYKNNVNNRMEYVHMFRILFNLFKQLYNVSSEDMLLYTTGLTMRKEGNTSSSPTHVDQEYNVYAEELSVLLNSLAFEFSAEAVGLKREVLVEEESQFVSKYGSNHFAQVKENQLVLRSSTEICLVVLESIARELSTFINLRLREEYRHTCNTMRQGHSYANVSPMYHTYELDCNLSVLYLEYNLAEDVMVRRLITNKTLFEEVKLELFYNDIFGYTVYLHVQVDGKFVRSLKKRVPKYVNGGSVVTMAVIGRRSDGADSGEGSGASDVMVTLKEISFPMLCGESCTSKHPIVVEDNLDYITVGDICVHNEGLPKVCFPAYSFGYVFDTRLLRVHMININPYPEILLTPWVQRSIVEGYFCILTPTPGQMVPNVSVPSMYEDTVCKEYINRCSLKTTKFVLSEAAAMPASALVAALRRNQLGVHLSTHFDEKHEEMLQVVYQFGGSGGRSGGSGRSGGEQSFILTHYNDSFYINGRSNEILRSRAKEAFSKIGSSVGGASHDGSGAADEEEDDEDAFYKGLSQIVAKTHSVHVVDNKSVLPTHVQTPKQDDATLYQPFGEISINYERIKPNVYMKFLNNYVYFYEGEEKSNAAGERHNAEMSPHFVNVSPYQYECLGAYAYLMNKFNILVNDSLNCDAIQMIIEVLLKANLGKYFMAHKDKKIHLNFFKRHESSHDVFDLVHMEIYEAHAPLKPTKTYKLNVSIDENNLNLLHLHRNVEFPNKYFSNVYILLFKAAYLSNGYDFYSFFYDLTGIRLIDSFVVEHLDRMDRAEREAVRGIQSVLKDQLEVSLERHTTRYDLLMNEVSLLAAYLTELTSSYRRVAQSQPGEAKKLAGESASESVAPLAGIKYFIYVDEFKHSSEKKLTANDMAFHLAKRGALMIRKKSLCCSNFVDEVENSLYYHILYRYVWGSYKFAQGVEDAAEMGRSIVQRLLGREVSRSEGRTESRTESWSESDVAYVANWVMGEAGYISRRDAAAQAAIRVDLLDCLNMDLQNHDENVITEFASQFDKHGALVSITMEKGATMAANGGDQHSVYFLFRNLAVPFVGETHKTETLELRRVLLLKGGAPYPATDKSVTYKVYIDNVNSNSIFMLEKVIFVSKAGDELVKEINVEYQTFFVHPYGMILNTAIGKTHLEVAEEYYDKALECHHYYNGLQVCHNPKFDYEGFSPYYVSYLENNQRKDILFKSKEEVANMINNGYLTVSKRFQLGMGGDVMTADVYRTIRIIVEEVAYSVGIPNLGEKSCGTLYLNRGQLHVPNDGKSLISNIFYDTNYCLDRGAILKEILHICNFEKEDLVKLFDHMDSNVLPYQLSEQFAESLTREEVLSLVYYFLSVPPQVNELVRKNSIYLEIAEGEVTQKGGSPANHPAVVVVPSVSYLHSLLISKSLLSPKRLNEESIVQFNVALYMELLKNVRELRAEGKQKVDEADLPAEVARGSGAHDQEKKVVLEVKSYLQSRHTCSANGRSDGGAAVSLTPPQFSNAGPLFKPDDVLTYNVPSFTYTDRAIYVKEQPEIHSSFNNVFLYEGKSAADGKFLSAIVVLSPHRFLSLQNVAYVGLIANTFDDVSQFVLKCYPHRKYDTSKFASRFNLEPNTVYLVCRNMPVKFLQNGLYEFNKYVVEYDTNADGTVGTHIYESMPIRPVYEVCNDPKVVVPKAEDVSVKVKLVQSSSTSATNAALVEYQIEVIGLVELHADPYVVIKPIFTHSSYLYNTVIYTTDDFVAYKYPRKLKYWEFLRIPFSKGLFKDKALTLRTVQCNTGRRLGDGAKAHCVYSLVLVKSCTLVRVVVRDLYGNEYEVSLDGEAQPQQQGSQTGAVCKPGGEVTKPGGEVTKPVEEVTKPVEEVTKPVEEVTKPVEEAAKPVEEAAKPALAPAPAQGTTKLCTSFLLSIQSTHRGDDGGATSSEKCFFLVHSSCIVREGVISLSVAEDRETYSTDAEEKHLMNRDTFDEIFRMICEQIKLQKGDYSVKISSSAQKGEVTTDKKTSVQRVHEDGSSYGQSGFFDFWKNGFNVHLFGSKGQAVAAPGNEADKVEAPKVEKVEKVEKEPPKVEKVEKVEKEPPKVEKAEEKLAQVLYDRRVDHLVSIKRTDAAYEDKYTLLTGTLNSSVTSVVVKDGKLSATCLEGDCVLENTFLEDMLNVRSLKDGTYELDIKKRIHLSKSDESDGREAPLEASPSEAASLPSSSPSSLRGGSARSGGTLACIVENSFNTLSGGIPFRKVVHVQGGELSAREGTYDVFITKGKYQVKKGDSDASAKDCAVIEKCINKAWKVKANRDYKFGVQLTTSVAPNAANVAHAANAGGARCALLGDGEKEYYLVVNKLGKNGMPLYVKNRVVHFIGKKGLVDGKYIVQVDGDKYVSQALNVTSDGAETTVSTTPLGKAADQDEHFFQDVFKMLHKKVGNGSYYVELSNSEIVDVNDGVVFTDQIVLTELAELAAASPQVEEVQDKDSAVKAYLVEVVSDDEDDEGVALYEELYILHGYPLKGGQFHIAYNDGECTLKSIVSGNEDARSSDMEKVLKISGRKMSNGGYLIYVDELFMDEQGEYFDNPYAPLWKKGQSGERQQSGPTSQGTNTGEVLIDDAFWKHVLQNVAVGEFHKEGMMNRPTTAQQSGPKGEEARPFHAFVHLDNDGQGNSCKFRKVLQGWGTGLQKGKYYVQVLNGSYFPTIIYGPKVNDAYLKMLIENAWAYPYSTRLGFYVDILPGGYQAGGEQMEHALPTGETYYSVAIKQLSGDPDHHHDDDRGDATRQGKLNGELIKIAGREVPTGEYYIEVTDEKGTATGMDASGKKMDAPFLKDVALLLYDMMKRGRYHVVITRDGGVTKTEQGQAAGSAASAAKPLNKTLAVTRLHLVDGSQIVQKEGTITVGIKVHPERNIPDGSYGMNVYTNGMIQIRGMYMGSSFGPSEEAELKRVLPSPPPAGLASGLYLVQVLSGEERATSSVDREAGLRSNSREGRDTSLSGSPSSSASTPAASPSCMSSPAGRKTSMVITNWDGSAVYYDNQPHAMGRIALPPVEGDRTMTQYQRGNCQEDIKVTHCTSSNPGNCRNVFKARRAGE
ncbi:oocyst capsule protein, putative [Plasmodium vivax]|uniref:Oocyst capsule protein, putative n=1 Tax=Plasmodium vivax TaxID=5855 RepID=A0A1G4GWE4_PLAVI|nr:oocyst capsule protein, putative [Plasmodium vivax]